MPILVPLMGMAIPMIVVPAALLFKHLKLSREWEHMERMEAIRMGVSPPPSRSTPGSGSVVAIGAGVPIATVLGAWLATLGVQGDYERGMLPAVAIIWSSAFLICALALATSLVLGVLQHRACARAASREPLASAKPAHDPDAFDLTGRHAY